MKTNSKVIFTMTEPDDLYIIGDFPWDGENKKLLEDKYGDRMIGITDDYMGIGVMGKARSKPSNYCETVGSFLLLTKKEWDSIKTNFENSEWFNMDNLHDEEYAIVIKQYCGPVEVDVILPDGESVLPEYDPKKDLMYQNFSIDGDDRKHILDYVVLLNSGFATKRIYLHELYDYKKVITNDTDDIFINKDTNEEFIGKWNELPDGNWDSIGERVITIKKWVKS